MVNVFWCPERPKHKSLPRKAFAKYVAVGSCRRKPCWNNVSNLLCWSPRPDNALRVSKGNLITNLIVREGDVAINLLRFLPICPSSDVRGVPTFLLCGLRACLLSSFSINDVLMNSAPQRPPVSCSYGLAYLLFWSMPSSLSCSNPTLASSHPLLDNASLVMFLVLLFLILNNHITVFAIRMDDHYGGLNP